MRAIWPSARARSRPLGQPIAPEQDQASENLVGAGRRITALVGREVKRTFSKEPQFSTGLSREKTLKADRQKVGKFIEVSGYGR
jgi:hypothetical protein